MLAHPLLNKPDKMADTMAFARELGFLIDRARLHALGENGHMDVDETARLEAADAKYQRACAKKAALETEVANRSSRRRSVQTAYETVLTEPVNRFEPRQWRALIDQAVVSQDRITFTFKSGHELVISL